VENKQATECGTVNAASRASVFVAYGVPANILALVKRVAKVFKSRCVHVFSYAQPFIFASGGVVPFVQLQESICGHRYTEILAAAAHK
jgi:hypothetical protein